MCCNGKMGVAEKKEIMVFLRVVLARVLTDVKCCVAIQGKITGRHRIFHQQNQCKIYDNIRYPYKSLCVADTDP